MKILTLILVGLLSVSANANRESGAGSRMAADFASTGRKALKFLSEADSKLKKILKDKQLDQVLPKVKLYPVKEYCTSNPITKESFCQDAHYDANSNSIIFSMSYWPNLKCDERLMITAHEYLRALGVEAEGYEYSSRFLSGIMGDQSEDLSTDELENLSYKRSVIYTKIADFCSDYKSRQGGGK